MDVSSVRELCAGLADYGSHGESASKYILTYPNDSRRYIMPIYEGSKAFPELAGVVIKTKKGTNYTGPKALTIPRPVTHPDLEYNGMAWYPPPGPSVGTPAHLVVVEDQLSALCVARQGVTAVALNGIRIDEDRAYALSKDNPQVHLCLDADATRVALRLAIKYTASMRLRVHRMTKDFKDMEPAEIKAMLTNITGDS
jgi:hypothetical protein